MRVFELAPTLTSGIRLRTATKGNRVGVGIVCFLAFAAGAVLAFFSSQRWGSGTGRSLPLWPACIVVAFALLVTLWVADASASSEGAITLSGLTGILIGLGLMHLRNRKEHTA